DLNRNCKRMLLEKMDDESYISDTLNPLKGKRRQQAKEAMPLLNELIEAIKELSSTFAANAGIDRYLPVLNSICEKFAAVIKILSEDVAKLKQNAKAYQNVRDAIQKLYSPNSVRSVE